MVAERIGRVVRGFGLWLLLALWVGMATVVAGPAEAMERFATSSLSVETGSGRVYRFTVELALTPQQQAQGLMFRESMAPDAGMLFVYSHPQTAAFWMKNTLIPLDMLFIAPDGRVVNIHERAVPHSEDAIRSDGPVLGILEINGGMANRLGIRPGDRVRHPVFGSPP